MSEPIEVSKAAKDRTIRRALLTVPRIRVKFSLTIGDDDKAAGDDLTVDLVGTHRDIPPATYDNGFMPNDDDRRKR